MGQKVSPHGLRVGIIKNWDSRWFASKKDYGKLVFEDYKIRKFLKTKLYQAGISKIEIERSATRVKFHIHCSKPGIVIGKGGTEIEKLKAELEKMLKGKVYVNIIEVKTPDKDAQLIAESVAFQLERRVSFRRAMKQSITRSMTVGAKGIKIRVAGRLGGAEIARSEVYHEGTIPLQTLRADIDYGFSEADTTYGKLGVKVWVYNGEVLQKTDRSAEFESIDSPDNKPEKFETSFKGRGKGGQAGGSRTGARGERTGFDRSSRTERSERTSRSESRSERFERAERSDRSPRFERSERTSKSERFERTERSDKAPRSERSDRASKFDRSDRSDRAGFNRSNRTDRTNRTDKSDKNDRDNKN